MKMPVIIFTIMLVSFHLQAEPPFKRHLDIVSDDSDEKYSTVGFYDSNTVAVTFSNYNYSLEVKR